MAQFEKLCNRAFERLGAVPWPARYCSRFMTLAGPLDATVYDGWIATRFEDVARARALLGVVGEGAINPHSGKWNMHFHEHELKRPAECAQKVFRRLASVLPVSDLYGADQRVSQQHQYAPDKPSHVVLQYQYRCGEDEPVQHSVVFQAGDCAIVFNARALIYATGAELGETSFVPGQVGLPDLQGDLTCWDPDRDTPFHEITGISWTQTASATDERTFDEFVDECVAVVLSRDAWAVDYRPPFSDEVRARRVGALRRQSATS